ncbi:MULTISPECIES: carbohydrate ABC transporter permease [unclassified Kitasatospora]|uniref:carbohydrate ABC transporter permease n=1 Tax=unclassified Kitasatospora TaxID=2633591 RepID=UPI00070DBE4B|nr:MULTISPECIES: carbohydrate ABC transporter permease [unclassified Kitasatospora]KQV21265.1 sugar ABC transporter permease [Kitasatospora sp. Root107]KRB69455.1 sugar ABC transporter permease [Kitasatospora sp. Root187]
MKGSTAVRRSFSGPLGSLFVIVVTVLWTIPTFGLLATSLRPKQEVATTGWWEVFTHPELILSNYHTVLFEGGFGVSAGMMPFLVNSLAISVPATVFPLVIAAMAAYALAWVRFRGSDTVFFVIFALQVVPLQMALIPLLQLFSGGAHLGGLTIIPAVDLSGTYAPVWLAHTMFALPLATFLLHNFISQLPRDLMEAAIMDGASHFKIFRSIVLPLCTPALASFAIFEFLWVWNDLLVALTFAGGTPEVAPMTVRLAQLSGSFGGRWELLTAGAFLSLIIPLIVFFALQRYFVRGLLAGSVKG